MNGILLSFIFSMIVFSLYWIFIYLKERFFINSNNEYEQILSFYNKLNSYNKDIQTDYFEVNDFLSSIPNIKRVIKNNKIFYYLNNKLIVKLTLNKYGINYEYKKQYKKIKR